MQKLLKYIILFGIFTLPFINSRITELLGFSFSAPVDGNYEFTKVMFFNIWSSLVISLFFITKIISSFSIKGSTHKGMDYIGFLLFIFYTILIFSTFFSTSPYISFFGNTDKSHSFLMWSNLVGLFIVFSSLFFAPQPPLKGPRGGKNNFFNQIIKTLILSGVFVSIIGLKEYFYPTFNYGELGNRLFSTFGHPNYLSIFLVSLMPFLYLSFFSIKGSPGGTKGMDYKWFSIILLFIITLIFTKSFIAIFLFICFNIYLSSFSIKGSTRRGMDYKWLSFSIKGSTHRGIDYKWLFLLLLIIPFFLIYNFLPEKLHSFISRYFIWETTIKIIFSDIKIFLIGGGSETLTYFFDNFKSEYVYIFENIGYTADRPHNLILNFFYSFGVFGLIFILGIYYKVFTKDTGGTQGITPTKTSLILILIFLLFNPTSIVIYLIITILLANLFINNNKVGNVNLHSLQNIFLFFITIISIFSLYFSVKFYVSEIYSYKNYISKSIGIYKYNPNNYFYLGKFDEGLKYSKIKTEVYYKMELYNYGINTKVGNDIISEYLNKYNYSESYFYVGDQFWNIGEKENAKEYYKKGLEKLPDLWNKSSSYYNQFLVKYLKINGNRFLSEKYGLAKILKRVGIR